MAYFDITKNLTWEDVAVRDAAHDFAKDVMRPIAKELDLMSAKEAFQDGSPFYDFMKQAYELGYHKAMFPEEAGGPGLSPLQRSIVMEELAWGSFGLATTLGINSFPFYFLLFTGNEKLIKQFTIPFLNCTDGSIRGCWGITEPNHGSDVVAVGQDYFTRPGVRADVRGKKAGDQWIINGQKSAWVSSGTTATHCLLHMQVDESLGLGGSAICIVPLDLEGISRGKPLEKLGQRDLNQGEIFFDNVTISDEWVLVGPEQYSPTLGVVFSIANLCMGSWATGLARAAFEESLTWVKERVQGGKVLIEHYSMRQRLYKLFSRVESSRALLRSVIELNLDNPTPYTEYSLIVKTHCTQACFDNAHEAVQIFGGSGISKEYPIEKMFRDARMTMIEDCNNEFLEAKGGLTLSQTYPRIRNITK